MKPPILVNLIWGAATLSAFATGYWMATSSLPPANPSGSAPIDTARTLSAPPLSDVPAVTGAAARDLITPEQARVRAFQILTDHASRVTRMRQLCDLLPQITSDNWRQVLDGFETARHEVGGDGGENYSLLLEHIGAVAGADAMQFALSPENVSNRARVITMLKGWANADAKACIAWYEAQPIELQRNYLGHYVAGVARTNPQKALELIFHPDNQFLGKGTTTAVVNNAVAVLGLDAVDNILIAMRGRQDLAPGARHDFFGNLLNKTMPVLQKRNEPANEVLNWFGKHAGQDYVSASDSMRIVTEAAKADPAATLSWLELQTQRLTPDQVNAGYHGLARELQKQTPEKFTEWLAANPTHPQRDNMMEAATGTLLQAADFPAALRMAGAIANEQTRARVTAAVQLRMQQKER